VEKSLRGEVCLGEARITPFHLLTYNNTASYLTISLYFLPQCFMVIQNLEGSCQKKISRLRVFAVLYFLFGVMNRKLALFGMGDLMRIHLLMLKPSEYFDEVSHVTFMLPLCRIT
jgi:hypothetical protein